jgi:hypothetical protein
VRTRPCTPGFPGGGNSLSINHTQHLIEFNLINLKRRADKMATDQRVPRIQPRLVRVEGRTSQADHARLLNAATGLIPVQIVRTERSIVGRDTSEPAEPMSSMQGLGPDEAAAKSRDCLQALEMIGAAARTMTSIEDESQRIRVNALALTQRVRSERIEADQQISVLQEQLKASHLLAEQLKQQLAEERARTAEVKASRPSIEQLEQQLAHAEERADVAEEWLQRLQEAIVSSFSSRRAAETAP